MGGVKTILGVLGLAMLIMGGIWVLQGLDVSWAPQSFMTAEKLSPQQALDLKFATGIIDTVKAMALYRNQSHNPYK